MDNSMYHNGSKMILKFVKPHVSRFSHASYSPHISPCDFWLFGTLKGTLKHQDFNSSDEIEKGMTTARDDLAVDDVQSVFQNWMSRLS
jgi:hypothetical protein